MAFPDLVDNVASQLEQFASEPSGKVQPLPLVSVGYGPARGDVEASIVVAALSQMMVDRGLDRRCVGLAWLHEVPYHPRHAHLARLFQESISKAAIPYETNRERAMEMCMQLASEQQRRPKLLMLVSQDGRKDELPLILEAVRHAVVTGELMLIASSGTAEKIGEHVRWAWRRELGRVGLKLRYLDFSGPIVEAISNVLAHEDRSRTQLMKVGSASGDGDVPFGFVPGALERLDDSVFAGVIWLHGVPYEANRVHVQTFLQERLTEANVRYATSASQARELLNEVRQRMKDAKAKIVLGVSATDHQKPQLVQLLQGGDDLLPAKYPFRGQLVLVATAGTHAELDRCLTTGLAE